MVRPRLARPALWLGVAALSACGGGSTPEETVSSNGGGDSTVDLPVAPPVEGDAFAAGALYDQATEALQARRLVEAASLADQALEADPASFPALMLRGDLALLSDTPTFDPALAKRMFRTARTLAPDDLRLILGEGRARCQLGEDAEARKVLDQLSRSVSSQPGVLSKVQIAHLRRCQGVLSVREGEGATALAQLDAALGIAPGDPESTYWKARALELLGRVPEARAQIESAIQRKPEVGEFRALQGRLLRLDGKPDEAVDAESLAELLDQLPTASPARRVELRRQLLTADGGVKPFHSGLIRDYLAVDQAADAETAAQAMLAAFPDDQESLYLLALAQAHNGKKEAALATLETLKATAPEGMIADLTRRIDEASSGS